MQMSPGNLEKTRPSAHSAMGAFAGLNVRPIEVVRRRERRFDLPAGNPPRSLKFHNEGATMSGTNWQLSGEYMESCNCDYLCPCIFTNPQAEVTYDHCTAALIFRIDNGHFGAIKLDGLCFALVIRSGKIMASGNWIFAGVVDAKAGSAQRQALAAIVGGQAGGPPGMIRANLVSDFRGIEYKPIDFQIEGLKRTVSIPDILSFEIEGVASRNGSGQPFYIDNTAHPANRRLALARARELHVPGFGLGLDISGKGNNGHFAPFAWAA
jgi:hypothetical protein